MPDDELAVAEKKLGKDRRGQRHPGAKDDHGTWGEVRRRRAVQVGMVASAADFGGGVI
jgi:hypothetical protein